MVACFLHSSAQMCLCQTPGTAPATYHRPFCEHCCMWSRVGRYIDMCCGCVCSLAAVCWPARTYLLCCAFVVVENRQQHPLPLSGHGSKGSSLPYMANEIAAATLFMVPGWRQYQTCFFPFSPLGRYESISADFFLNGLGRKLCNIAFP